MRKEIVFITISLLLILLSARPLYLMGQEVHFQKLVSNQYKIENIYHPIDMTTDSFHKLHYLHDGTMKPFPEMKREIFVNGREISDYSEYEVNFLEENHLSRIISFYNTEIALVDTFTGTKDQKSKVQILIQGQNYAEPVPLQIRPFYLDNNRYHGFLGMLKMTNHSTKEEDLIIVQRLFEDSFSTPEKDFKWKVISINKDGLIKTDIFSRDNIDDPAYRKDLINKATVSPYALGYKSNILHYYPSLFYPLLYPFGTVGLGFIFLVIGIVLMKRKE